MDAGVALRDLQEAARAGPGLAGPACHLIRRRVHHRSRPVGTVARTAVCPAVPGQADGSRWEPSYVADDFQPR